MMIDRRLVGTVPESRRHVAAGVACQWVALLANMALILAFCRLLEALWLGRATAGDLVATAVAAAA